MVNALLSAKVNLTAAPLLMWWLTCRFFSLLHNLPLLRLGGHLARGKEFVVARDELIGTIYRRDDLSYSTLALDRKSFLCILSELVFQVLLALITQLLL